MDKLRVISELARKQADRDDDEDIKRFFLTLAVCLDDASSTIKELMEALDGLQREYVNLLTAGRSRIIELGGQCDSVETMANADHSLRTARSALSRAKSLMEQKP